jgi:hypothetical protein
VMLAAQAGRLEVVRLLAEHGANLHTLALDQKDLLECAAEGGNVDIVRYLIAEGHPVDGHWRPRSKVSQRTGHMTPLIMAAINGHPDAVRVLLEAGADRKATFDGQTALALIQDDIKHPLDADASARVPRLQQIAAMLTESAGSRSLQAAIASAVTKFAENARRPAYARLRSRFADRCGDAQPWRPAPDHGLPAADVLRFTLAGRDDQQTLDDLRAEARGAGYLLVLEEPWVGRGNAALVLFPTDDKLAVVASVGTEGVNQGVQTSHIIELLDELDGKHPFHLVLCRHDMVGGVFTRAVKNVDALAARMVEICPGILDEGIETAGELARALERDRTFLLRWD